MKKIMANVINGTEKVIELNGKSYCKICGLFFEINFYNMDFIEVDEQLIEKLNLKFNIK